MANTSSTTQTSTTYAFVCDEMLQRLGRWLRAAGYDVILFKEATPDRQIFEYARQQNRWLLTRDRRFAEEFPAYAKLIVLRSNSTHEHIAELNGKLVIDWQYRPFSRCMECNTLLRRATDDEVARLLTVEIVDTSDIRICPQCNKLLWNGTHVARMRKKLQLFGLWR